MRNSALKLKMAGELTNFIAMLQLWILVNVSVQACDPPCLYFSAGRVIKSIELSSKKITSNVTEPQAHDDRVIAVAVDVEEKTLYWSDQVSRTIKWIDLQSRKIEVVASKVGHCEGIAIDWVHKYIYWTDNKNGWIEMSRVNESDRKILFDRDVQNPRGVTVDPVHGYMFWTDYGDNPKIERATLAGQDRTAIITNGITVTRLKYPNDVLVDYSSNKIYWVDAGLNVVGTADLEGRNIVISEPIENSHLFAVALYNNTLYISDMETNAKSIIVIDKESLKEIRRFTSSVIGSRDLFGMTMLHESRQPPVISPCRHGNGGCSHLCFIVPYGYRCGCPSGTALREDGFSCQEANYTNCRTQPCQNGGTCYYNFQKFTDDCTCSKYYAEKDCGLYLGSGAVSITLEMEVKEWEEETFQQAIMRGLDDYCKGDNCGLRNESISKQFCPRFLNNSAFSASQVAVIGQPVASLPNLTKVEFAVILRPVSSSQPLVVVNTTLEHIVWERANPISKHFNKIVLVNYLHPSSDTPCPTPPPKSINMAIVIAIAIPTSVVVILLVLVVVAVWCRRRYIPGNQQRGNNDEYEYELDPIAGEGDNQQRGNDEQGDNGGYDPDPMAGQRNNQQRGNNEQGNNGGYDLDPMAGQRNNQQRYNNEQGNNGEYRALGIAGQRENQQRDNNEQGNNGEYQALGIAGQRENQQRDNNEQGNNGGYELDPMAGLRNNQQVSHRIVIDKDFNNTQASFGGANRERLNILGNQQRQNSNEQNCEVTDENEVGLENDNQQLEEACEDMGASQELAISQKTFESATGRQPIENDDYVSGTYTYAVQCTDTDIEKNQH